MDSEVFAVEAEQLDRLLAIAARLQGGSDRERDAGHQLWVLLSTIRDNQKITPESLSQAPFRG